MVLKMDILIGSKVAYLHATRKHLDIIADALFKNSISSLMLGLSYKK